MQWQALEVAVLGRRMGEVGWVVQNAVASFGSGCVGEGDGGGGMGGPECNGKLWKWLSVSVYHSSILPFLPPVGSRRG